MTWRARALLGSRPNDRVRRWLGNERGSVLPLIAGYVALSAMLVLAGASVTSLYIEHKRLLSVADAASLAATEAFTLEQFRRNGQSLSPELRTELVASVTRAFLAEQALEDVRMTEVDSPDARSATVRLATKWRPPVVSEFLPLELTVEVSSTGRTVFR